MVLLADPHRHADEAEAGAALVHHAAAVVVVLPVDLPVDNGAGDAAVSGCGRDTGESPRASHGTPALRVDLNSSLCSCKFIKPKQQ